MIYLCRIPPCASLSCICSYLFYSAGLSKTNKASAPLLPSSPAVATDLKGGGWEGRLLLAPAPAWQRGRPGQRCDGSATASSPGSAEAPQLPPWPCHPSCSAREPGFWVPSSLPSFFIPMQECGRCFLLWWSPISKELCPALAVGQLSPAVCPAAGCAQSSSWPLIPNSHHGCSSVDLGASRSVTLRAQSTGTCVSSGSVLSKTNSPLSFFFFFLLL